MDYSLPGSSVHGIFQARVLEWGAMALAGDLNSLSLGFPDTIIILCNRGVLEKTLMLERLKAGGGGDDGGRDG